MDEHTHGPSTFCHALRVCARPSDGATVVQVGEVLALVDVLDEPPVHVAEHVEVVEAHGSPYQLSATSPLALIQ